MTSIDHWLAQASSTLISAGIESARLDSELILAHTIRRPRTHLHAHGDQLIDARQEEIANARLELRLEHTPVAYIIGHKEFYGRRFKTTPAALIPRPESEAMIDLLKSVLPQDLTSLPLQQHLVDVGTGTGCLGISAKLEWPELDVTLIDISNHSISLARENAKLLNANVNFLKSDLLHGYSLPIDIVLANLPYVDRDWDVSPDTHAEPEQALYADENGLSLIYRLIQQASKLLKTGGHLLIESDQRQQEAIIDYAAKYNFTHKATEGFITLFSH